MQSMTDLQQIDKFERALAQLTSKQEDRTWSSQEVAAAARLEPTDEVLIEIPSLLKERGYLQGTAYREGHWLGWTGLRYRGPHDPR